MDLQQVIRSVVDPTSKSLSSLLWYIQIMQSILLICCAGTSSMGVQPARLPHHSAGILTPTPDFQAVMQSFLQGVRPVIGEAHDT